MPNNAKGRSNYRVDPERVVPAKGYGSGRYSNVRILWDATLPGDPGFLDCDFPDSPIDLDSLNGLINGLNEGQIADRWELD